MRIILTEKERELQRKLGKNGGLATKNKTEEDPDYYKRISALGVKERRRRKLERGNNATSSV